MGKSSGKLLLYFTKKTTLIERLAYSWGKTEDLLEYNGVYDVGSLKYSRCLLVSFPCRKKKIQRCKDRITVGTWNISINLRKFNIMKGEMNWIHIDILDTSKLKWILDTSRIPLFTTQYMNNKEQYIQQGHSKNSIWLQCYQ